VLKYGEGASGIVAQSGEPLMIDDYRTWSARAAVCEEEQPFISVLSVPMISHGQVIGVIHVHHTEATRSFKQTDLDLLTLFASQAAIAVENAHLVEGLEEEVAARTAEIRVEQEKIETILRSVGDAIATVDLELKIQYVNETFTSLTGYAVEEILGRPMCDLMEGLQRESCHQEILLSAASGEIWQDEQTIRRKDGRCYDAALTIAALHDGSGRMVGFVSSHRDISRLKDLDRARNQFITNISHQLRTPLTNMKLYTHLLRNGKQNERAEDHVEVIENQIDQLIDVIEDTLEIAAFDSGQQLITWESILPSSIIDEVVTVFQSRAAASGLNLRALPAPPGIPVINGDRSRLASALKALLENAVNFTPCGGQVILSAETMAEAGREWVTLSVRDTGYGIPREEQERVFDRFFRGRLAESGQIPGTGLGLSLAKEIVHAHGGRITLDSKIGVGTVFTLWLPSAE
jgi:two-component system sensor histidine kinase VicK